ncbi:hypothetical protein [Mucilaginibacter sp.]|uniref:hypothetical protein n=1 Tax=Mucilaginibacter sp. TaxID=1882438 RepID=UPI003264B9FC
MRQSILDVAPQLAEYFIDVEFDPISVTANKKIDDNRLGKYRLYLGLLHDSWILKTTINPDRFFLRLNDFTTHVFADALVEKKGLKIQEAKLVFKIDIDFQISDITFNKVDDDGYIYHIKAVTIDEYLYEEIISVSPEVMQVALVAWANGNGRKQGSKILILMEVKSIVLTEYLDSDWDYIFGKDYDKYYKRFKLELLNGTYLSDQSICGKLIDEIDRDIVSQH